MSANNKIRSSSNNVPVILPAVTTRPPSSHGSHNCTACDRYAGEAGWQVHSLHCSPSPAFWFPLLTSNRILQPPCSSATESWSSWPRLYVSVSVIDILLQRSSLDRQKTSNFTFTYWYGNRYDKTIRLHVTHIAENMNTNECLRRKNYTTENAQSLHSRIDV